MQGERHSFSPSRSYLIKVNVNGIDKSNDLTRIQIASSISASYPSIEIFLTLIPAEIINMKLFGGDPIKLTIQLLGQTEIPKDILEVELMLITSEFEIPVTTQTISGGSQADRVPIRLLTVPRESFKTITTPVNKIYGVTDNPQTPRQIVQSLVSDFAPTVTLECDLVGAHNEQIPQICIPPTTLYKAIHFIDSQYGIYDGVPVVFCTYDNKLQVMNLSSRMKNKQTITIYHLSSDGEKQKIIDDSGDGKTFFTYDNVYNSYVGNTKFGVLGSTLKHIVFPSDTLSYTITQDLSSICKNSGIIDKNLDIPFDDIITGRTKYYTDHSGFEKTEVFASSMIAKQIYDLSRISFLIKKNLKIENLLCVGEVVKFISKTDGYKSLDGKYILFSSDLNWIKRSHWETTGRLELVRTNKTIF